MYIVYLAGHILPYKEKREKKYSIFPLFNYKWNIVTKIYTKYIVNTDYNNMNY